MISRPTRALARNLAIVMIQSSGDGASGVIPLAKICIVIVLSNRTILKTMTIHASQIRRPSHCVPFNFFSFMDCLFPDCNAINLATLIPKGFYPSFFIIRFDKYSKRSSLDRYEIYLFGINCPIWVEPGGRTIQCASSPSAVCYTHFSSSHADSNHSYLDKMPATVK